MRVFTNPTTRAARALALAGTVTAAGLLLAACGGAADSPHGTSHGGTSPTASATASPSSGNTAAPGAFNDADVLFAQTMIPHHQQALEMAGLAAGRAEDPEVKRLAAAIEQAQDPEIQTMRSWLKAWGRPETAGTDHSGGHDGGHGMAGMMTDQQMKELAAAKGKDFDRRFAELMIAHHEGAVAMAEDEKKNGRDATAKRLADDVVRTQSAEIAQLRKILDRL